MTEPSTLAAALVAALAELVTIDKGRSAKIPTKDGKSYSYTYADIADVVAETRPVLAKNGLVALTPVSGHERGLACTVTLVHVSGEEREFQPLPFTASTDPQQAGSAITYYRRYALLAALGMATIDDDGAAAKEAPRPAEPRAEGGGRLCPVCEKVLTGKPVKDPTGALIHEGCAS